MLKNSSDEAKSQANLKEGVDMNRHRIIPFSVMAFVMLLVPALLAPGQSQAQGAGAGAKWTYMVYMAGDGNLEHWLIQDIGREFGKVGSNQDVNIVLLADRNPGYGTQEGNWTDTRIFYVHKGDNAASTPVAN